MLTQCLILLLHAQSTLCEHLPSIGFLPSIIQALECRSNDAIVASAVKVLFALCKSDLCLQTFASKFPIIISAFKQAMQTRRDHLGKYRMCTVNVNYIDELIMLNIDIRFDCVVTLLMCVLVYLLLLLNVVYSFQRLDI
jgi:hypothetical protein